MKISLLMASEGGRGGPGKRAGKRTGKSVGKSAGKRAGKSAGKSARKTTEMGAVKCSGQRLLSSAQLMS